MLRVVRQRHATSPTFPTYRYNDTMVVVARLGPKQGLRKLRNTVFDPVIYKRNFTLARIRNFTFVDVKLQLVPGNYTYLITNDNDRHNDFFTFLASSSFRMIT